MPSLLRQRSLLAFAAIVAGLIALALWPASTTAQPVHAIPVSSQKLESHRIAGELILRHAGTGDPSLYFEVIVDESGAVSDVRPVPDEGRLPPDLRVGPWLPALRELAATWRFRPFTRDGRPVPARAPASVAVLPPERLPTVHVPFPAVPAEQVEIELSRSGCFGTCPSYAVTVRGDGNVRFVGYGYTLVDGARSYAIPREEAAQLIDRFRAGDYWSLEDAYEASVTDNPTYVLTVRAGGRTKSIRDYAGTRVGMPQIVRTLEDAVDAAADTARWVVGNERTLASLEAEGFDFRSRAAAAMVVGSLPGAPESLPLGLIDRGAPLRLAMTCEGCPAGTFQSAAVTGAVAARRLAVFDRLDRDGAVARLPQREKDELLMIAARAHSATLVERLLAHGANSRARSTEGGSALIEALNTSYVEPPPTLEEQEAVVRILLRRGVDLRARDGIRWTALQHAYDEDPRIVRLLIEAGADVNERALDSEPLLYITEDEELR